MTKFCFLQTFHFLAEMMMKLIEALQKSHDNIRNLGQQLINCNNATEMDSNFQNLWQHFFAHEKAEEYIAFKVMHRGDSANESFSEKALQYAVDEHHYFEQFVEDISLLTPQDSRRAGLIRELVDQLDSHMRHEEAFIFPRLAEQLNETKQDVLVNEYNQKLSETQLVKKVS